MIKKRSRNEMRKIRHERLRRTLSGTADKPRLAVFRSEKHISVQLIDDDAGHTLAAASTVEPAMKASLSSTGNAEAAKAVGKAIAERAISKGIKAVVFDRGGHMFHGRVKALAEAAREAGLEF
ncbi:50S ribosomal protein L18 [Aminiphilus sp.]|uniref:50S ribosomal protein L18 n=1 Tax=Aminiphilus sp. TaxID=1872488 RepID=UPI002601872D|nr:50S ribosomal protein L18 [Aminiphilus sp.]